MDGDGGEGRGGETVCSSAFSILKEREGKLRIRKICH